MSDEPGWEDFEPMTAEEVIGVALIAAGVVGPDPEGYGGVGVTMDRQLADEIAKALREAGYLTQNAAEPNDWDLPDDLRSATVHRGLADLLIAEEWIAAADALVPPEGPPGTATSEERG